jgi:hydrogenase maturation protein HypF
VEGQPSALAAFLQALRQQSPPFAPVARLACEVLPPVGERAFTIAQSEADAARRVFVSPDLCVCADCLHELFDPSDRRSRYPLVNCTNCAPRFTIITDVPYDRERTTMATFRMCPDCQREYADPTERRFQAQPDACPCCGPGVRLLDHCGRAVAGTEPLARTAVLLRAGAIVAI